MSLQWSIFSFADREVFCRVKRPAIFSAILCLLVGALLGMLLPSPWERPAVPRDPAPAVSPGDAAVPPAASSGVSAPPLDAQDNLSLLEAACAVGRALRDGDRAALAARAHPLKGVTFTPYSSVDFETDLAFTPDQLQAMAQDKTVYAWGFVDGRGSLIEMTMSQYFERYVWDADYTKAPRVGLDQVIMGGNALENVAEAYPGCRFVDFCFPGSDGTDWTSLKLVFEPGESRWLLVGIVHGEWTV